MPHRSQAPGLEVVVATFPDETRAAAVLAELTPDAAAGVVDATAVVRDVSGNVRFEAPSSHGRTAWAKRGAVAGAVAGLVFPPSLIAGALVGGAGGALLGRLRDKRSTDDELEGVGQSLQPGSSALVVLVPDTGVDALVGVLHGYGGLTRHHLDTDAAAAVLGENGPGCG